MRRKKIRTLALAAVLIILAAPAAAREDAGSPEGGETGAGAGTGAAAAETAGAEGEGEAAAGAGEEEEKAAAGETGEKSVETEEPDKEEKKKEDEEKDRKKDKEGKFEFFFGAAGGYEWFKIQTIEGEKIINESLDCSLESGEATVCVNPDNLRGHGGLIRGFLGVRLGIMGISVDYRQSYIQGPINWGQLMADFYIFILSGKVKPFFKIGIGWIYLKVKDVNVTLYGTDESRNGDMIKGGGLRGGAGLLVKPIKWISIGAACEVTGMYFREFDQTTWGYAIDVMLQFGVHIG